MNASRFDSILRSCIHNPHRRSIVISTGPTQSLEQLRRHNRKDLK